MKKLFTTITTVILFFSFPYFIGTISYAQSPDWLWAKSAGGNLYDGATSVAVDASGNIYVVGFFRSSSIIFGSDTLTNAGMFLVKYDTIGNVIWVKTPVKGNYLYDVATSVIVDASSNIIVTGYFGSSSIIFGSDTLNNAGGVDVFLVKYDASGNVLWAKSSKGNVDDRASSVTVDANGNIIVAGNFESSSIIFGSDTLNKVGSGANMFLVKYDAIGNVIWAKSPVGSHSTASSVTVAAFGNIIVTGNFGSSSIIFGLDTLNNAGMFLVKYDTIGNVIWAKNPVGGGGSAGSVTIDVSGNILVAGSFGDSTLIFGLDTLRNVSHRDLYGNKGADMFLAKYNASGNVLWAKRAGGVFDDGANSITTDAFGNILVAGNFYDAITFGSDTLIASSSNGVGYTDIFIAKYDVSGNAIWAKRAGGTKIDAANSITTNASGNIYLAGYFYGNTTFGSDTLINAYSDFSDMFIAKLGTIITVGIENLKSSDGIIIYPNPSNGTFTIEANGLLNNTALNIYSIDGRLVYAKTLNSTQNKHTINFLNP